MIPFRRIAPKVEREIDNFLSDTIGYVSRGVDLGCGNGSMGRVLKKHVSYLVGVEKDRWKLSQAEKTGCYDELVLADIREYDLPSHAVAFLFEVIEHLPVEDGYALLNRIGTRIVLSTPAKFFPIARNGHISGWTAEMLEKLGFRCVEVDAGLSGIFYGKKILAYK